MKTRSARRALQADDDTQGGTLVTDETEEPNEPCDPDGDGDDDCNASGDSDHSHWNENGEQVQALPGQPLMPTDQGRLASSLPRRRVDHSHEEDGPEHRWEGPDIETRWDGPAAMSSCASSSTPASCYGSICAGKRAGDPSLQSTWALPHHTHPGGPPDPAGVRNALARLGSTQGLTNRDAAEAHLKRHMASISPDSEKSSASYGMERRYVGFYPTTEVRSDGASRIAGYSAVFNQPSENLGFFREVVDPGTFRDTIARDHIMALWNHDPNFPLGGTRDGRLSLREDDHGLFSEVRPTNTTYSRDLLTNITEGVIRQQSFGFQVEPNGDQWTEDSEGLPLRHLRAVKLFDISIVTFPAYRQTSADVRRLVQEAGLEYRSFCWTAVRVYSGLELAQSDDRILTRAFHVRSLRHALEQISGVTVPVDTQRQKWRDALDERREELERRLVGQSVRQ